MIHFSCRPSCASCMLCWVSKLVEDFLAFSMDVILVTLELIHLEFLGWNAVPKNGPVSCEMGLNYDQTNAKLTFRMQFRGHILYSCFRVSVSPATWKYVYIGAPMINESHLRWLVTSQTGVVPVSWEPTPLKTADWLHDMQRIPGRKQACQLRVIISWRCHTFWVSRWIFREFGGCEYELGMGKWVSLAPLRHVFGASYGSPTQTSMSFTDYGSGLAEHIDSQMQRFIITWLINHM